MTFTNNVMLVLCALRQSRIKGIQSVVSSPSRTRPLLKRVQTRQSSALTDVDVHVDGPEPLSEEVKVTKSSGMAQILFVVTSDYPS